MIYRYTYRVPASGTLDMIQVAKPLRLSLVAIAHGSVQLTSANLAVLNGEGTALFESTANFTNVAVANPCVFSVGSTETLGAVAGGGAALPAGCLPPDLIVLPGETVRLTVGGTPGPVVVTWVEVDDGRETGRR